MKTLYDILEVSKTASIEEIKRAYRRLALKYHPDVNKGKDTVQKFKEVVHAYEILSDRKKREEYDRIIGNNASSSQKKYTHQEKKQEKKQEQKKENTSYSSEKTEKQKKQEPPNKKTEKEKYFCMKHKNKQGPFSKEEIEGMFLEEDTLVVKLGEKEWKKIKDIPEFEGFWIPSIPMERVSYRAEIIEFIFVFWNKLKTMFEFLKKTFYIFVAIFFLFWIISSIFSSSPSSPSPQVSCSEGFFAVGDQCMPAFTKGVFKGKTYETIKSSTTGKIWLDRNIGAERVCESSTDKKCYGEYYAWNESFKKTDGTDVCPVGFHIPTKDELSAENIENAKDAFTKLKIPLAGFAQKDGKLFSSEVDANLWSITAGSSDVYYLNINNFVPSDNDSTLIRHIRSSGLRVMPRSYGFSLRCVK